MPEQNQKDDDGNRDAEQPKKNCRHLNLLEFEIMTLSRNSEAIHSNSRRNRPYGNVVTRRLTPARTPNQNSLKHCVKKNTRVTTQNRHARINS